MAAPPTIRSLARKLRLSTATVSEALRDSPRVKPDTRARVVAAANKAGYRPNPLLGAALAAIRRGRQHGYRGTLALVDAVEAGRPGLMLFHREVLKGATARAEELGFKTELFWVGDRAPALPHPRLCSVLTARGIAGTIILPLHVARDFSDFDFDRLPVVQMDHCLIRPQLHTILPDHYVSMMNALERLTLRGYKRIGLCLERTKDLRLKTKWSAGYWAFFHGPAEGGDIPALISSGLTETEFLDWYRRHRPDLIVAHQQAIVDWLARAGVRVPAEVGFFKLNVTERTAPCAGLDLQPGRLGAAAVDIVTGMAHRGERGVPKSPHTITLEALWEEGPTIRPESAQPPSETAPAKTAKTTKTKPTAQRKPRASVRVQR